MNCQQIRRHLFRYGDGSLSPETEAEMQKHLQVCPSCKNYYHLTQIENEVLSQKDDIPLLANDFTSKLMASIQTSSIDQKEKSSFARSFLNLRYSAILAASAAVIALCIYSSAALKNLEGIQLAESTKNPVLTEELSPPGREYRALLEDSNTADNQSAITDSRKPDTEVQKNFPTVQSLPTKNSNVKPSAVVSISDTENSEDSTGKRGTPPSFVNPVNPLAQPSRAEISGISDMPFLTAVDSDTSLPLSITETKTKEATADKVQAKLLVPTNLSPEYQLSEVRSISPDSISFDYLNTNTKGQLSVQIIYNNTSTEKAESLPETTTSELSVPQKAEYNKSTDNKADNEQLSNYSTSDDSSSNEVNHYNLSDGKSPCLQLNVQTSDQTVTVILSGDIAIEEITRIAESIQIKEDTNYDDVEK